MIGGVWTRDMIGWTLLAAALPVAVEFGFEQGIAGLVKLALALATIGVWQAIFRFVAGVAFAPASGIAALALAMMAPADAGPGQLVIAASFGAVVGELILGGWGRNFLNPGTVALAFLVLSLPLADFAVSGTKMAVAIVPGAVILAVTGILSLPILVGFGVGVAGLGAALGLGAELTGALGSLAFFAVFLVADPVTSAATGPGRWIYGFMAGGLTALLTTGAPVVQAAIFGTLLAALFAPLIDQAVIAVGHYKRMARGG